MILMKSLSEIINDLIENVSTKTPFTNFNPSAAIRNLLEVVAAPIAELYQLVQTVTSQSWVETATGEWLDLKVREVGITRLPAIKSQVYLTFSADEPPDQNIVIPQNTICKSVKDEDGNEYRFYTTEETVLEAGEISVVELAEAEEVGSEYNVGEGTITRMVTPVSGISVVTNIDWEDTTVDPPVTVSYLKQEGTDAESDEQLRQRAIGTWEAIGIGGTRTAYKTWAMSAPGVVACSVLDDFPFGPGTVGVVIVGPDGDPSAQLIQDVYNYIKLRKPLTADVRVLGPVIETVNIEVTLTRFAHAGEEEVEAGVLSALEDYAENLQLGEGVILSRLLNRLMEVSGVYNVAVNSPTSDLPVSVDTFIQVGEVNITHRIKGRTYQDANIPGGVSGDELTVGEAIPGVNRSNFGLE